METSLNQAVPTLMHIDLNSCFASVEQQANPLWRGKPLAVAAYDSPGGCILSPSVEAKKFGIKTGFRVKEARELCPNLIVRMPDPPKYHFVHDQMMKVFQKASPYVIPKSVDEAVLGFEGLNYSENQIFESGKQIKMEIKKRVGEWLTVSIGIATNRFLAKLGSGLHKPDGLDLINYQNLEKVLGSVTLLALPGINIRFEARLNAAGIFTPIDFFNASRDTLQKEVFKSIGGYHWFLRLRGWESDSVDFSRKSFGQEYAIGGANNNPRQLSSLLLKLVEKMGRRLRAGGYNARGIHVACWYQDHSFAHKSQMQHTPMYSTKSLFIPALRVLNSLGYEKKLVKISVSCYELSKITQPGLGEQLSLFEEKSRDNNLSMALDKINDRFGDYTIKPALMMEMEERILERVAFGGRKDLIK